MLYFTAVAYTQLANPFDDGNGNYMTNLVSTLPQGSQVLTWPPGNATFSTVQKLASGWQPAGYTLQLPPGVGFFVRNGPANSAVPDITNTFVGSVIVGSGQSITNPIELGYVLKGSAVPYAGNLATSGTPGGDATMNYGGSLTGGTGSQILTWNATATPQAFKTVAKLGTGNFNGTATIAVGEGFFTLNKAATATNVVQSVP